MAQAVRQGQRCSHAGGLRWDSFAPRSRQPNAVFVVKGDSESEPNEELINARALFLPKCMIRPQFYDPSYPGLLGRRPTHQLFQRSYLSQRHKLHARVLHRWARRETPKAGRNHEDHPSQGPILRLGGLRHRQMLRCWRIRRVIQHRMEPVPFRGIRKERATIPFGDILSVG